MRDVQAEEAALARKGHLKIFLGYASGVGKSFRMLDEARRRRERGQDIVVGAVQYQVPREVEALLPKLEVLPLKSVDGGTAIEASRIRSIRTRQRSCPPVVSIRVAGACDKSRARRSAF